MAQPDDFRLRHVSFQPTLFASPCYLRTWLLAKLHCGSALRAQSCKLRPPPCNMQAQKNGSRLPANAQHSGTAENNLPARMIFVGQATVVATQTNIIGSKPGFRNNMLPGLKAYCASIPYHPWGVSRHQAGRPIH